MRRAASAMVALVALAWSSSAAARGKGCVEVSDVVGYEHCTRYGGTWSVEKSFPIVAELAVSRWSLDPRGITLRGNFGKHEPGTFEYSGDLALSQAVLWGGDLRFTGYPTGPFYLGIQVGGAGGHLALPSVSASGYRVDASSGAVNAFGMDGGLLLGFRVPIGFLSARLETMLGGRVVLAGQDATSGEYGTRGATVSAGRGVVEQRLLLDAWIGPRTTLSAFGGIDVTHVEDRVLGLAIGLHGRSFDGAFFW